MFKNIIKQDDYIIMGKESAKFEDLFIHLSDYGDSFYDLVICFKSNGNMFGDSSWCGIPENKLDRYSKGLKDATGITLLKKEYIKDWDY